MKLFVATFLTMFAVQARAASPLEMVFIERTGQIGAQGFSKASGFCGNQEAQAIRPMALPVTQKLSTLASGRYVCEGRLVSTGFELQAYDLASCDAVSDGEAGTLCRDLPASGTPVPEHPDLKDINVLIAQVLLNLNRIAPVSCPEVIDPQAADVLCTNLQSGKPFAVSFRRDPRDFAILELEVRFDRFISHQAFEEFSRLSMRSAERHVRANNRSIGAWSGKMEKNHRDGASFVNAQGPLFYDVTWTAQWGVYVFNFSGLNGRVMKFVFGIAG